MKTTKVATKTAAALTKKVAAMTPDQRFARMHELSAAKLKTAEHNLEFAKLIAGPDATYGE